MVTMEINSPLHLVNHPLLREKGVEMWMKRDDMIHPEISGNKWRKLKYNLQEAKHRGQHKLLTFGGAYSNHILAVAAAAAKFGFESIGVIRGEEHLPLNPTLAVAKEHGMHFTYMNRSDYRDKYHPKLLEALRADFGDFYMIPEGGSNDLAVQSCTEILGELEEEFDVVCSAVGTGATAAGLILSLQTSQSYIGFPALKAGDFLSNEILNFIGEKELAGKWQLNTDYHFGGYAKIKVELIDFMNHFKSISGIPLDPVYTGKMCYGIFDMIQKDHFSPGTRIVLIHTGGLQGIAGMNERIASKGWKIE